MTYADLYRQTKIQETVYELLTQQYELAKVEEAKEIPTVKVLDAAIVPTKKTFPPRSGDRDFGNDAWDHDGDDVGAGENAMGCRGGERSAKSLCDGSVYDDASEGAALSAKWDNGNGNGSNGHHRADNGTWRGNSRCSGREEQPRMEAIQA